MNATTTLLQYNTSKLYKAEEYANLNNGLSPHTASINAEATIYYRAEEERAAEGY